MSGPLTGVLDKTESIDAMFPPITNGGEGAVTMTAQSLSTDER
ncbi:hypothetical protein [Jonesia quinghaiensis]|nr:hypothetical protein [Jonesia quinghaiensis]